MKTKLENNYTQFCPNHAFLADKEDVPLESALERKSGVLVNLYPPGDIVLCAGEAITQAQITLIEDAIHAGEDVLGLTCLNPPMISVVKRPAYEIVTPNPQALSRKEVHDYCNLFREVFYNPPYCQLAYRGQDWKHPLSASEVIYGRPPSKRDYVDIETIDNFDLPSDLSAYMDKSITEAVMSDRFRDPGYMALLYETSTGKLKGFCYARVVTLRRVWETEEFKWPLILSGNKSIVADEDRFFSRIESEFGLKPDMKILSVSGQAIHPDVRGRGGWFGKLMAATVQQISVEHAGLPGLTELSASGPSRTLNAAVAKKICEGILKNGHPLAFVPTASHSLWHYEGPPSRLIQAIRNYIQKEKSNV